MLFWFVIAFLPRRKQSFNLMTAVTIVIFGAQEKKICHCFYFFPFYLPWSDVTGCHDLSFLNVEFQASFFTRLFHLHQEVTQSCLTLFDPMDCSLPGSSIHGIFQARKLEWVTISFSTHFLSFNFIKRSLVPPHFLLLEWYHMHGLPWWPRQ